MKDLLLASAFVQVDTIKGYGFLADAGKIMNRWDEEFPMKNIGVDALGMSNEQRVLRELKVTFGRIWLHFVTPESVGFVVRQGSGIVKEICNIMDIRECRRVGVRLQYVREAENLEGAVSALAQGFLGSAWVERIALLGDGRSILVAFGMADGDLHVGFRTSTGKRNPKLIPVTDKPLPADVALFDFDVFTEGRTDVSDMSRFLTKAEKWMSEHLDEYTSVVFKETKDVR